VEKKEGVIILIVEETERFDDFIPIGMRPARSQPDNLFHFFCTSQLPRAFSNKLSQKNVSDHGTKKRSKGISRDLGTVHFPSLQIMIDMEMDG
jgi:hypothetical protein